MIAAESPELVRLRVLWYALRQRGHDAAGAPGIAYDRPMVQSSPQQPAVPHGYGMGHARDPVSERLAALAGTEPGVTLAWLRGHPAEEALRVGGVASILDAMVRELAPLQLLGAWGQAGRDAGHAGPRLSAHVETAGRMWARARVARAWAAWVGEAASAAEGTTAEKGLRDAAHGLAQGAQEADPRAGHRSRERS